MLTRNGRPRKEKASGVAAAIGSWVVAFFKALEKDCEDPSRGDTPARLTNGFVATGVGLVILLFCFSLGCLPLLALFALFNFSFFYVPAISGVVTAASAAGVLIRRSKP